MLLACLAAALPALLIELQQPDVVDPREAHALATSLHTLERWHEESDAGGFIAELLVPHLNGDKLMRQPPGLTWAHMLTFTVTGSADPTATVDRQVLYARIASVVMGLLLIASVYWAGHSIDGMTTAVFAALICAANPFFLYHARLASPTIYTAAWTMLSIAAALWAIRPLRPQPSIERQFIGWTTCGLALAAAILTQGPHALLVIFGTVLLVLLLCPSRIGHLMGLVAATLIGVLAVLPWAVYVQEHDAGAWPQWFAQFKPSQPITAQVFAQHTGSLWLVMLIALAPWTLWVFGALVQPFSTSSAGSRNRLFLGWSWFVLLVMIIPVLSDASEPGPLLWVVPAASVLVAQLFQRYADLAAEGRYPRIWRTLRWPHLALMLALSVAVPLFIAAQPNLVARGVIDRPLVGNPGWFFAGGLAIVLVAITVLSLRWMVLEFPGKTLLAWVSWSIALMTVTAIPLTRSPLTRNPMRGAAFALSNHAGKTHVYWLRADEADRSRPDPALLLYARRDLWPIVPQHLGDALHQHGPFFVIGTQPATAGDTMLTGRATLNGGGINIWRVVPAPDAPAPADAQPH